MRFGAFACSSSNLSNSTGIVGSCPGKPRPNQSRIRDLPRGRRRRRSSSGSLQTARRISKRCSRPKLPIWDDFTGRGRFLEARLVRAVGGSEQRRGIQDYLLHIVAADHEAHEEHDRDPRFRAFLAKAERFQPDPPLVWFGETIFERRS